MFLVSSRISIDFILRIWWEFSGESLDLHPPVEGKLFQNKDIKFDWFV